jgi:hypothetical protein
MPKQLLTGTVDEQCEFLYTLAQEKMAQGNFTGAVHALQEVIKHRPRFRDAQALLAEAKARKAIQTRLLIASLVGALLFVGIGTVVRLSNDLFFLLWAALGAIVGYGVGNWLESYRRSSERAVSRKR